MVPCSFPAARAALRSFRLPRTPRRAHNFGLFVDSFFRRMDYIIFLEIVNNKIWARRLGRVNSIRWSFPKASAGSTCKPLVIR